jgi:hypothetical protein
MLGPVRHMGKVDHEHSQSTEGTAAPAVAAVPPAVAYTHSVSQDTRIDLMHALLGLKA